MKLIVAVDKNWAIGNKGDLLTSIPEDKKFFRETTTGNVVVMGKKTLLSFPNGLPLKNRINIVLTTDVNFTAKDAIIVHSLEELDEELKKYNTDSVYVIGGALCRGSEAQLPALSRDHGQPPPALRPRQSRRLL